jgi:hypothetical protein
LGSNSYVPVTAIDGGNGFRVGSYGNTFYLQFIFKNSWCVTSASRYWFGDKDYLSSNYYSQTTSSSYSASSWPSAFSISWESRAPIQSSSDTLSMLVRWGSGSTYTPSFSISDFPSSFSSSYYVSFTLSISHSDSNEGLWLFAVCNDDFGDIQTFPASGAAYYAGTRTVSTFDFSWFDYSSSATTLDFYVITEAGTFASNRVRYYITHGSGYTIYADPSSGGGDGDGDNDNGGSMLGIIIGAVVGGIVLIALIAVCHWRF